MLNVENNEVARRNAQLQDPFPDHNIGPDTDFRPREFGFQRSEQQLAKSRSYASWLKIQARPASVEPQSPSFAPGQTGPLLPGMGYQPPPGLGYQPPPGVGYQPSGYGYPVAPAYGYPPPAMGTVPFGVPPSGYPQRPF